MGKMKEKYMEEQERLVNEAVNAFIDDDWQYQEYLKSLSERMGYGTVTQEEVQSNHDDWWNSLTEEQKQKLYEETEAAEQDRIDNDINGPNNQYGV
mgnify:CR=1 FL=1